jgi:ssDNA-binding replication factor A large subunit
MIKASYEQLVERISRLSALDKAEIQRRIDAKKAKLSGLISNEGAAQIIAAELGISFEKQTFKIFDLLIGMKKVSVTGKIIDEPIIRKFVRQGKEAEVASFTIADDSSNIRVVLWDTKHIEMLKTSVLKKGSVIETKNADVRGTLARELHLNSFSELMISDKEIDKVNIEREKPMVKRISELKSNERVNIRANILQLFNPSFFYVCPECNMKVSLEGDKATCVRHGSVLPKKRAILNVIIDDGSENIRAMAFHEIIFKLFNMDERDINKLEDTSFMIEKKQEVLGSEFFLIGRSRANVLFNRDEFVINECEKVEPDMVIKELSKS